MATGLIHMWARVGGGSAERAEGRSAGAARAGKRARRSGAQPGLDAGENIKTLSLYLGHSDAGFTLRVYTHLMPSSETRTRKAVSAMYRAAGHAHDGPETAQAA
ncbi:integrase [Streptomyces canus]|uniref:integrase n=1 Tax=Streptomyces canus TaxID=58343 RepID=UPI00386D0BB6